MAQNSWIALTGTSTRLCLEEKVRGLKEARRPTSTVPRVSLNRTASTAARKPTAAGTQQPLRQKVWVSASMRSSVVVAGKTIWADWKHFTWASCLGNLQEVSLGFWASLTTCQEKMLSSRHWNYNEWCSHGSKTFWVMMSCESELAGKRWMKSTKHPTWTRTPNSSNHRWMTALPWFRRSRSLVTRSRPRSRARRREAVRISRPKYSLPRKNSKNVKNSCVGSTHSTMLPREGSWSFCSDCVVFYSKMLPY